MKKILSKFKDARCAVYIDGANLFYAQKILGWRIDMLKLRHHLMRRMNIVAINYYSAYNAEDGRQIGFLRFLGDNGFEINAKRLKIIRSGYKTFAKGNLDVEMTMDILQHRDNYDVLILFSGDSDFAPLIQNLHGFGKKCIVISVGELISHECLNGAYVYIDLNELRMAIERPREGDFINRGTGFKLSQMLNPLMLKRLENVARQN